MKVNKLKKQPTINLCFVVNKECVTMRCVPLHNAYANKSWDAMSAQERWGYLYTQFVTDCIRLRELLDASAAAGDPPDAFKAFVFYMHKRIHLAGADLRQVVNANYATLVNSNIASRQSDQSSVHALNLLKEATSHGFIEAIFSAQ
jgi:hypothetical protein